MTVKEYMYLTFCKHFPTIPKYLVFDMQILITEETLDDYYETLLHAEKVLAFFNSQNRLYQCDNSLYFVCQ